MKFNKNCHKFVSLDNDSYYPDKKCSICGLVKYG